MIDSERDGELRRIQQGVMDGRGMTETQAREWMRRSGYPVPARNNKVAKIIAALVLVLVVSGVSLLLEWMRPQSDAVGLLFAFMVLLALTGWKHILSFIDRFFNR